MYFQVHSAAYSRAATSIVFFFFYTWMRKLFSILEIAISYFHTSKYKKSPPFQMTIFLPALFIVPANPR